MRPAGPLLALRDAFDAAAQHLAARHRYRIAGARVGIDTGGGAAMRSMLIAFEPLRVIDAAGDDDLSVLLFDGAAGEFDPGAMLSAVTGSGEGLAAAQGGGVQAFLQPDIGVLALYDDMRKRGYIWYRDAATLPYYEYAAPLRHLLQWWMLARGGVLLHSAGIGDTGGGVLVSGPSGAGKSSTALACLESSLRIAGDDYVAVDGRSPATVHALYSTAKVDRASLGRHPSLAGHFRNLDRPHEKPMLFIHQFAPERLVSQFPLRALVVPNVAHAARTSFEPMPAAETLRAIAPSSILLFPLAGRVAFGRIAALCRAFPAYRMNLSPDAGEVADALARFIGRSLDTTIASQCA
jgi:hypothetical protein